MSLSELTREKLVLVICDNLGDNWLVISAVILSSSQNFLGIVCYKNMIAIAYAQLFYLYIIVIAICNLFSTDIKGTQSGLYIRGVSGLSLN